MTLSLTLRASLASIAIATLAGLLLNCAPHGDLLSVERLLWIAASLFLYSGTIMLCFAIPAHLVLRRLGLRTLSYYLVTGIGGTCIAYIVLYRIIAGEFWLGGMLSPLAYNALVGLFIAPIFHYLTFADSTVSPS